MTPTLSWVQSLHQPRGASLDVIRFVRDPLEGSFNGGYYGNLDLSLGPLVLALTHYGRHRPAAVLLGGMMTMPTRDSMRPDLVADATTTLGGALGDDLTPLLEEGRSLPKRELARLALAEVDHVLAHRPA